MRHPNKSNKKGGKKKAEYKGPYQNNPNQDLEFTRKHMNPNATGPTIDTFSQEDSTTFAYDINENETEYAADKKRPTRRDLNLLTKENIILFILTLIAGGIGLIVYNHSNSLVAIDKDIEHIQEDVSDHEETIKEVCDKATKMDKEVSLLKQRVDLSSTSRKSSKKKGGK